MTEEITNITPLIPIRAIVDPEVVEDEAKTEIRFKITKILSNWGAKMRKYAVDVHDDRTSGKSVNQERLEKFGRLMRVTACRLKKLLSLLDPNDPLSPEFVDVSISVNPEKGITLQFPRVENIRQLFPSQYVDPLYLYPLLQSDPLRKQIAKAQNISKVHLICKVCSYIHTSTYCPLQGTTSYYKGEYIEDKWTPSFLTCSCDFHEQVGYCETQQRRHQELVDEMIEANGLDAECGIALDFTAIERFMDAFTDSGGDESDEAEDKSEYLSEKYLDSMISQLLQDNENIENADWVQLITNMTKDEQNLDTEAGVEIDNEIYQNPITKQITLQDSIRGEADEINILSTQIPLDRAINGINYVGLSETFQPMANITGVEHAHSRSVQNQQVPDSSGPSENAMKYIMNKSVYDGVRDSERYLEFKKLAITEGKEKSVAVYGETSAPKQYINRLLTYPIVRRDEEEDVHKPLNEKQAKLISTDLLQQALNESGMGNLSEESLEDEETIVTFTSTSGSIRPNRVPKERDEEERPSRALSPQGNKFSGKRKPDQQKYISIYNTFFKNKEPAKVVNLTSANIKLWIMAEEQIIPQKIMDI